MWFMQVVLFLEVLGMHILLHLLLRLMQLIPAMPPVKAGPFYFNYIALSDTRIR